jgi:hypothetical protein
MVVCFVNLRSPHHTYKHWLTLPSIPDESLLKNVVFLKKSQPMWMVGWVMRAQILSLRAIYLFQPVNKSHEQ